MNNLAKDSQANTSRRSFLKKSVVAGAVATVGGGILGKGVGTLERMPVPRVRRSATAMQLSCNF